MDVLVIVRDWLNKYLETPADQFLAGILATIVLGLIGAFIPSVRKLLYGASRQAWIG